MENKCDFMYTDTKKCDKNIFGCSDYCCVHKCHFSDSCLNSINKNPQTHNILCVEHMSHKCNLNCCGNIRKQNGIYCDAHNCRYPQCNKQIVDILSKCFNELNVEKYYCGSHYKIFKCAVPDCKLGNCPNSVYCDRHK